jgi:hypothetical protein
MILFSLGGNRYTLPEMVLASLLLDGELGIGYLLRLGRDIGLPNFVVCRTTFILAVAESRPADIACVAASGEILRG